MKTENVNFKAEKQEVEEYKEVSKILDIPFSQLAREAIRKHIAGLKQTDPRLIEAQEAALAE